MGRCDKDEIINHLIEMLNDLNLSTEQCVDCDWVDYYEDFESCHVCKSSLCGTCVIRNDDYDYCRECFQHIDEKSSDNE